MLSAMPDPGDSGMNHTQSLTSGSSHGHSEVDK